MDNYKNGDDRRSLVLEGMYNGMAGKIEEVRQSVQRELQYTSAQQADAYDALAGEVRTGIASLLAELRYVAQQSSAIYDLNNHERDAMRDSLAGEIRAQAQEVFQRISEHFDARIAALGTVEAPTVDYDALAERVAEILMRKQAEEEAKRAEEAAREAEAAAQAEGLSEETAVAAEEEAPEDAFDYDLLAEKIALAIPETDYDLLADKVVALLSQEGDNAFVERIAAAYPQTDENALADRLAESVPAPDYDFLAEHISAVLADGGIRLTDESAEHIAMRVAELLRAEEDAQEPAMEEPAPEETEGETEIAAAEAPAEPQPEPVPQPQPEPVQAVQPPKAASKAKPSAPVMMPVVVPVSAAADVPPDGMTTRYKRSFIAKIIESEDDVKEYYSGLKNALLGYQKAASQVSWSNDRFTLKGETVAKIGIRGRTLCLYVALNPSEFPESVYHQKYAGDTKMYEKTPMMVKIRSGVAMKRAIRLIELLMEKNGAVKDDTAPVDYAAQYAYRSEEELLAQGLIKTAIVEKSDLDF